MLFQRNFTLAKTLGAALAICTLASGYAVLDSMVSEKTKECKAKGGQMEPTKGFYVWRGPNDIDHVFDYECSVK